jgi:hypothetical protein
VKDAPLPHSVVEIDPKPGEAIDEAASLRSLGGRHDAAAHAPKVKGTNTNKLLWQVRSLRYSSNAIKKVTTLYWAMT